MLKFDTDIRVYIGQSIDVHRRLVTHRRDLIQNKHHNYKMQEVFNLTNCLPIETVLEETTLEHLNSREIYWIKYYDSYNNGFNLTAGGVGNEVSIIGEHFNAKYTKDTYYNILLELTYTDKTNKEIADYFSLNKRVVDSISCFSNHKYLLEEHPELCKLMLSKRGKAIRYICSPTGIVYPIEKGKGNAFAKEHGLDGNSLNSVLRGALKSTAGWRLHAA